MADTLEEIEARRAKRKAAAAEQRAEQRRTDMSALDALEVEHGDGCVMSLDTERFVPGIPTLVVVKTPSGELYKRFCQQVRKAGENKEARGLAQDLLAKSCWIYPSEDAERAAMLEAFPGTLVSITIEAAKLAELKTDAEGKG